MKPGEETFIEWAFANATRFHPLMTDRERVIRWFVAALLLPLWIPVKLWRVPT